MTDLSNLSLAELRDLEAQVKDEIKGRQAKEIDAARRQILEIAQSVGLPLEALMTQGGKGGAKGSGKQKDPAQVRFQHPDDSSKQWSGRGRQPGWVKEWAAGGKNLEDLRVK